ncbi:MAG: glycosyltransferase [Patescibacteria group bacterium]
MKIFFFSDNYSPATNGIVTYILNTKKELEARGHIVYVFAPDFPNQKDEENVFRFKSASFLLIEQDRMINPLASASKLLPNIIPDIIHCQLFLTSFPALKLAKIHNTPTLVTYHTLFSDYLFRINPSLLTPTKSLVSLLTRWYFNKFDVALTPSGKSEQALLNAQVKTKVIKLNNGINLKPFARATDKLFKEKFNIKGDYILSISTLDTGKNVHLAIEALPKVLSKFPHLSLVIAGRGNEDKNLKALAKKLHLEKNIYFVGFLTKGEAASAYQGAKFTLELSQVDNLPTVVMEASAAGKPIIALRDLAIEDLIKENVSGLLINKADSDELADLMVKLLSDNNLLEKLSDGSKEMSKSFSIENHVDKLEKIYREQICIKKS